MLLTDQLAAIQKELRDIQTKASAEGRDFTDAEIVTINKKAAKAAELKLGIERAEKSRRDLAEITGGISYIDDGNGNIYEDSPGGGEKTFFALSGDRGEKAAAGIARQMRGEFGSKALTPVGQMLSNQVFDPIPIDTQKVPNSIITILNVRVRETATWRGIRQAGFVNRASIVPPGATKPTTAISIEPVDHSLAVLAHLTEPVDKFLLEDNSHLVDFIDRNMLFGLEDALEDEVLNGDGSVFAVDGVDTKHFLGILHATGTQTQSAMGDQLVTLRSAAAKLEATGFNSDVFIVNGNDWAAIESRRNLSGQFDLGAAVELAARRAWGARVVTSTRIPEGTAVALDLKSLHIDTDNRGVRIAWDASGPLFDKNQFKARVEGRFNLSIERPEGIVIIALDE
jgi:HK97 family phage major capsid protein